MRRLARCGPTPFRTRFWVAQRLSAAKRPALHERKGHGFTACGKTNECADHRGRAALQGCVSPLKSVRALAPEGLGRLLRKPLEKDCHPERSEGSAVRRRGEPCVVWHAADQLHLALDFRWRSASALRKDLPFATDGKGTASAVPPREPNFDGFSR
jgi:hypothetical protein